MASLCVGINEQLANKTAISKSFVKCKHTSKKFKPFFKSSLNVSYSGKETRCATYNDVDLNMNMAFTRVERKLTNKTWHGPKFFLNKQKQTRELTPRTVIGLETNVQGFNYSNHSKDDTVSSAASFRHIDACENPGNLIQANLDNEKPWKSLNKRRSWLKKILKPTNSPNQQHNNIVNPEQSGNIVQESSVLETSIPLRGISRSPFSERFSDVEIVRRNSMPTLDQLQKVTVCPTLRPEVSGVMLYDDDESWTFCQDQAVQRANLDRNIDQNCDQNAPFKRSSFKSLSSVRRAISFSDKGKAISWLDQDLHTQTNNLNDSSNFELQASQTVVARPGSKFSPKRNSSTEINFGSNLEPEKTWHENFRPLGIIRQDYYYQGQDLISPSLSFVSGVDKNDSNLPQNPNHNAICCRSLSEGDHVNSPEVSQSTLVCQFIGRHHQTT